MSAIPIVIAALQASAPVVALVGTNIHAIVAPQAGAFPSCVVMATSESEEYALAEGAIGLPEARVTVICRGSSAGDVSRLGDAVVAALKNARGTFAGSAATIWRDDVDSTDYTDEGKAFRRIVGFRVSYRN